VPHLHGVVDIVGVDGKPKGGCARSDAKRLYLRISRRVSFESGWAWPKRDTSRSRNDMSESLVALVSRISSSAPKCSGVRLPHTRSTLAKESFVMRTMLIRRYEDQRRMLKTRK